MLFAALTAIGASLLILTGGAKLVDPDPTAGALRAAGLPSGRWVARGLGLVEVMVAVPALVWGEAWSAGVGILYLGFAGFVGWSLAQGIPIQSCGCFGRADTPPTVLHIVFDLVMAGGALGAAVTGTQGLAGTMSTQPWLGVPYLGFVGMGVYLSYLLLAELPKTIAIARGAA